MLAVRDRRACPGGAIIASYHRGPVASFFSATAGLVPAGPSLNGYNARSNAFAFDFAHMPMPEPLYTVANCRIAYQLHWSLTLFAKQAWPEKEGWWQPLREAVEPDGVRLLEFQHREQAVGQFFVSSRPEVSPAEIVRSVKGRLQHLVRDAISQFWRRHYSITSVGDANNDVLQEYVARQVRHHPMADRSAVERLLEVQFHDPLVDLAALRASAHGRFTNSLHMVLENADRLCDTREEWLAPSRATLIAVCRKKGWLLSRLALAGNHLHMLFGCDVVDVPRDAALSLMNNLAFAHGMKPICEHSFYVGTFGPYDHDAIRRRLSA